MVVRLLQSASTPSTISREAGSRMGVRQDPQDHVEPHKDPFSTLGQKLHQDFEPPESLPADLNRVESLARVCSLSKVLAETACGSTDTSDEPEQVEPPSPKKLKNNRKSLAPTDISSSTASPSQQACKDRDMQAIPMGIYTRAERKAKLERYQAKKHRRTFSKKILYACRKSFADSRPRVGGRFIPLKDLTMPDAQLTSSSRDQRTEKEFSELLASISEDLANQNEESRNLANAAQLSNSHSSDTAPTEAYHSASFTSSQTSSFASFALPPPILSSQFLHVAPQFFANRQQLFCSPRSFYSSLPPLRSSSASYHSCMPSTPFRASLDDPSASLLLLSLASSAATRAVF